MNICFICNEYPPMKCGGIGIFVKELAEDLVARGHTVFVVGIYNGIKEDSRELLAGVTVIRLQSLKGFFSFYTNRRKLYNYVKTLVKNNKIDLIEAPDFDGMMAFWSRLNCKIVVRLHGSYWYFAQELQQKCNILLKKLESWSINKADVVVACSEYVLNKSKIILPIKNKTRVVIYNSVKHYDNIHYDNKRHDVVFCGSLAQRKGIIELIKAWNLVWKKSPQVILHVIGKNSIFNGESMQKYLLSLLDERARQSVVFYGHIDKERIIKFYSEALLGIFPSHAEAFALVPMEAMSVGCPVIYSKTTSGQELIEDGIDGVLCDPYDHKDIAAKIEILLGNEELRKRLGQAGNKKIAKYFSRNVILQKNLKLYETLVAK